MNQIINYDNIYFTFKELSLDLFKISKIWYEYYEPSDLNDMLKDKSAKEWLDKNIFNTIKEKHTHPYFTILGEIEYKEFTYIFSKFTFGSYQLEGYVEIVSNEIGCATIFVQNKTFIFSSENYGYIDNRKSFNQLCNYLKIPYSNIGHIACVLQKFDLNTSGINKEYLYHVPVIQKKGTKPKKLVSKKRKVLR